MSGVAEHSLTLAFGGGALLGSVAVFFAVARYSWRSVRHVKAERARRQGLYERQLAEVAEREQEAACSWSGYRKFQIVGREAEDDRGAMVSLYLTPFRHGEEGQPERLPRFRPGQYVQIRADIPGQANLLTRCYSISQAYAPDTYRITVARAPGGADPVTGERHPPGVVSNFLFEGGRVRSVLELTVPQGDFWVDMSRSEPVVLVGWGIHTAPLLCMFEALAREGRREVWLFVEVGSEPGMFRHALAPLKELAQANRDQLNIVISSFFGSASEEGPPLPQDPFSELGDHGNTLQVRQSFAMGGVSNREGRQGFTWIKRALPAHYKATASFYVSAPALALREAKHDLEAWGVPEESVHFEVFDRASLDAISEVEEDTGSSQVSFETSGVEAAWDPSARTLLGLAADHKVRIPSTCKIGKCGECEVALSSGKVRYVNEPDWKVKPGHCLPCVCVPASSNVVVRA
ncbi:MAG TPA: hypothetical protein DEA08_08630 [Planctomycetes bacterium]|nr:hypothetical protein [Planctomycetota bacterium]